MKKSFTPDPDGPPPADAGFFGLSPSRNAAQAIVIAAPFEVTVSYRAGTANAPEAIRKASHQVDLFDLDVNTPTTKGIFYDDTLQFLHKESDDARKYAERVIHAIITQKAPLKRDVQKVNQASKKMIQQIEAKVKNVFNDNKLPFLLGGDHSVAEGALRAAAKKHSQMTIVQFDAHADLRDAYEGFEHSHASIMYNIMRDFDNVTLVQIGIRDLCTSEDVLIKNHPRIHSFTGRALRKARDKNELSAFFSNIASACGPCVYISFDIDGLDPSLCPNTGTPVPGGLSFDEAISILEAISDTKRIIGGDLVEVCPSPHDEDEWDALVAARLLHKLIGFAFLSKKQ